MNKYYKKFHRFNVELGYNQSRQKFTNGSFFIRAMQSFIFKKTQIDACRKVLLKILKAENKLLEKKLEIFNNKKKLFGSLKICLFPDYPMSEKPKEARMGKGKGAVAYFYFPVARGRILFELNNVTERVAISCFNSISSKIPSRIRLVYGRY